MVANNKRITGVPRPARPLAGRYDQVMGRVCQYFGRPYNPQTRIIMGIATIRIKIVNGSPRRR